MKIENTNKLTGIGRIFYFNSDDKLENKNIIETQFDKWQIQNCERIPYTFKNYKEHILDKDLSLDDEQLLYNLIRLKSIIDWYDNFDDEYCIFMEDNINIDLANYWNFNWKIFIKLLPYNWDCIQLNTNAPNIISMHLKPKDCEMTKTSCFMITRQFAKKVKNLHYFDGKYKLHINTKDWGIPEFHYGDINFFLSELGICYTFPIFNTWGDYSNDDEKRSSIGVENWWKYQSKKFTVFEQFHFNKPNDNKMQIALDDYDEIINDQLTLWI